MEFNKFLNWLSDDGIYVPMISDVKRNLFYDKVLGQTVANKNCIDVGFGTGLLAVIACHHGAKSITAFEQDADRYELGQWMLKRLGLSNKIKLFHDTFISSKHIEKQHDLLYHELIGQDLWDQNLFLVLNNNIETVPNKFICDFVFVPIDPEQVRYESVMVKTSPLYRDIRGTNNFETGLTYDNSFVSLVKELFNDYKTRMYRTEIFEVNKNYTREQYNDLRKKTSEILLSYSVDAKEKLLIVGDTISELDYNKNYLDFSISKNKLQNKFGIILPQFKFGWNDYFYTMDHDTSWEIPSGIIFVNDVKSDLNIRVYLKPIHSIGAYKSIRYHLS